MTFKQPGEGVTNSDFSNNSIVAGVKIEEIQQGGDKSCQSQHNIHAFKDLWKFF